MTTEPSRPRTTTPTTTRPPTPVADEELAGEVRRLAGYTTRLHAELEAIRSGSGSAPRGLVGPIAWGVFIGLWAFALTGGVLIVALGSVPL